VIRTRQTTSPAIGYAHYGPYGFPISIDPLPTGITIVGGDTSTGNAITFYLPNPSTVHASFVITVKDEGANAATANITVGTDGGTIEGTTTISTDGGFASWYSNGVDTWFQIGLS